jgi:hypothetical protein
VLSLRGAGVEKVEWTDGTALMATISPIGRVTPRTIQVLLDLSDDRSFLSERHRDLIEQLPNLSIHPGQPTGQGWVRLGAGAGSREIHVVLRFLPAGLDLVLGQCAAEFFGAPARPQPD